MFALYYIGSCVFSVYIDLFVNPVGRMPYFNRCKGRGERKFERDAGLNIINLADCRHWSDDFGDLVLQFRRFCGTISPILSGWRWPGVYESFLERPWIIQKEALPLQQLWTL